MTDIRRECRNCRHFVDDAEEFEEALPGILALSSGQGSTRGDQGLCQVHERLLYPAMTCERFERWSGGSDTGRRRTC